MIAPKAYRQTQTCCCWVDDEENSARVCGRRVVYRQLPKVLNEIDGESTNEKLILLTGSG